MDRCVPAFSKVLVTPDPHYIPGYAGYCPQLKFRMGKSYGRLTADLLTGPDVSRSGRLLVQTRPGTDPGTDPDPEARVIPGYTGFIPKSQNYFACSYAETCRKALADFNLEGQTRIQRRSADLPLIVSHTKQQCERPKPPPTVNKVISYKPPFTPTEKPYFMEDGNSQKYFISGFTGHVPKSRFLIGKGYPITTNHALIQFAKQQRRDPTDQDLPERKDSTAPLMPSLYPSHRGMVPSFTGHIPGFKFMYGHTFGHLSQNALEKSGIKRILHEK